MSGRKKNLSNKLMNYNIVLIGALFVLVVFLSLLMHSKMTTKKDYYKIESRVTNIENSKESDDEGHKTIGWVRVQGTNIDYPIYGELSEEFDTSDVYQSYLWSLNEDSEYHNSLLLFGHNVMNLGPYPRQHDSTFTRLEELMNFVYYDFAKENQYIQLTMNGKNYLYKIFSVDFFGILDLYSLPKGEFNALEKKEYLELLKNNSIYDYNIKVSDSDDIITIATCSKFFMGRNYNFLIAGKRVKDGETIDNYRVHRNKNYEKVDDILKGANEDETYED